MKELLFDIEFISDIVLPATSNNQGNIKQLDFIPGSNFLGMVAKEYNNFSDSFSIFHNANVRFGDATLLYNNKPTYKIPLSFFHAKTDESNLKNHLVESLDALDQAKQLREGYITQDKEKVFVNYNYSQKSAYDKEHRRSKDAQMYGYRAIQSGTKWQFTVKLENSISKEDETLLIKTLQSSTRLGKSKSAEYGQVKISYLPQKEKENLTQEKQNNEIFLYINSRLALVDAEGNPTYDLKTLCSNLKEENIVYEKTQIRTSTFTPYNGVRKTQDYERLCINKGGVIVLKNISKEQIDEILQGVGAYLSEGFGEILINPTFLTTPLLKIIDISKIKDNPIEKEITLTDETALFLKQKETTKTNELLIANEVADFISQHYKDFRNIKPSQWGNIRSIATNSQEYQKEIFEYIKNGTKKWEEAQIKIIEHVIDKHTIDTRKFLQHLAIHMPKINKGEN